MITGNIIYSWMCPMRTIFWVVFFMGTLFAIISQNRKTGSIRLIPFLFSFLTLWIPISFSDSGVDYYNYIEIIKSLTWNNYLTFGYSEPGFNFLCLILTDLTHNEHIPIFVFKTLTLYLFYDSLYKMRYHLRIWQCVATYLLLFYLPSFYLIAICFTASVVYYAFSLYYFGNSRWKMQISIILIFIAGYFHNSAFIFFPIYLLCLMYDGAFGLTLRFRNKMLICMIAVVLIIASSFIFQFSASTFESFHYQNYADNSFEGSGALVLVKYGSLFTIYYFASKAFYDRRLLTWFFIMTVFSCLFFVMSYTFIVIERMEFYTMMSYIILIPLLLQSPHKKGVHNNNAYISFKMLYIIFILVTGISVVQSRTGEQIDMSIYRFTNFLG